MAKAAKRTRVASSAAAANANSAAQNAAVLATSAAQNASSAAQTAASAASKGVKQGVYSARSWAAPRLDNAAEYCTTTVAPKVSDVLHSTARQVSPPPRTTSKRSSILLWSLLGGAVLAAAGAAAAMVRYRYRTAIAADSEPADEEVLGDSTGSHAAPASPDGSSPNNKTPKDKDTETSANGRVTATGW